MIRFEGLASAISIVFVASCLVGCAGMRGANSTSGDTKPSWSYGNHCGANYPTYYHDVPAVDDLDLICKLHDRCYVASRGPSSICDFYLGLNLIEFSGNGKSRVTNHCAQLIEEMMLFVQKASPKGRFVDWADLAFNWLKSMADTFNRGAWKGPLDTSERCNSGLKQLAYLAPSNADELAKIEQYFEKFSGTRRQTAGLLAAHVTRCKRSNCRELPLLWRNK
jgi:hypothetical protein